MPKRESIFDVIYDLALHDELSVTPNLGESPSDALARWKRRTTKYQSEGRYYRLKIVGENVVIQRIRPEERGKLADFRMMPPGSMMLMKSKPTKADEKKAWSLCDRLDETELRAWQAQKAARLNGDTAKVDKVPKREGGRWRPHLDGQGRLVVDRLMTEDPETYVRPARGATYRDGEVPLLTLWNGEWD